MILTETEKSIVGLLRSPIIKKDNKTNSEHLSVLNDKELLELYNKMDSYIDEEGEFRTSLGSYDEMFVLELFSVKDKLKSEYEKRIAKSSVLEIN